MRGDTRENLREIASTVAGAQRVLFITGAGMSTDSGLPTYRGVGGLYDCSDTEDGVPIQEALSGQMFATKPELTWKYLWQIADACRGAKPNRGHEIIAAIEKRVPDAWVLTQNVDGLHHAAGSNNLIEIHGRAADLYCIGCGERHADAEFLEKPERPAVPRCSGCGGILRPDVVLFGEFLHEPATSQLAAISQSPFDIVFSIGTSSLFPYISAPVERAAEAGVPTVEINPERTLVSSIVRYQLPIPCAAALEAISTELESL